MRSSRRALALGALREAPQRAQRALERVARIKDEIEMLTGPGEMGEDEARAAVSQPTVVGCLPAARLARSGRTPPPRQ